MKQYNLFITLIYACTLGVISTEQFFSIQKFEAEREICENYTNDNCDLKDLNLKNGVCCPLSREDRIKEDTKCIYHEYSITTLSQDFSQYMAKDLCLYKFSSVSQRRKLIATKQEFNFQPVCGDPNPLSVLYCNYYSLKNNTCCYYKYGTKTACFFIGQYFKGMKQSEGLYIECSSNNLLNNYYTLLILTLICFMV
jgi:hypothetical protein